MSEQINPGFQSGISKHFEQIWIHIRPNQYPSGIVVVPLFLVPFAVSFGVLFRFCLLLLRSLLRRSGKFRNSSLIDVGAESRLALYIPESLLAPGLDLLHSRR
jgi:hypothetical protein